MSPDLENDAQPEAAASTTTTTETAQEPAATPETAADGAPGPAAEDPPAADPVPDPVPDPEAEEPFLPHIGDSVVFVMDEASLATYRAEHGGSGNVSKGELYAAVITRVWNPTCVNLTVFVDGPGTVWVTSASQAVDPANPSERTWF
jgi:hypothetical protein